ncbi:metaxin-3 [Eurytemora carolleeae]|uniref:metaxin-3 n=1 Tax=Eurytemora carolleeae TaxID=1294199 RepID=UPI000C76A944|nr:metaxin-3 [Eurytemora carolleeae]|eukprot:XP_023338081.1 metaxin-3-like [Eurytemora affinis]
MELECWGEDWGITSVDPECLKILAFAKFSGAPLVQKSTNNPFWSPKGNLPVFRHNGIVLTDFLAVAKHLKSCNYSADYNLTNKQISEAGAFINLMEESLKPALQYITWVDTKNHINLTRVWFGKHLPFPYGLFYPNRYEKAAVRLIESLYPQFSEFGEIGNDTEVETAVYKAAQECLTLLSNRLADSHYLFGMSASSVDAVMYGYLAPLLKAPYPNNTLQNYLKNCSNLVRFVVRISQNYFPKVVKSFDERGHQEQKSEQGSTEGRQEAEEREAEWPNQTRNKVEIKQNKNQEQGRK